MNKTLAIAFAVLSVLALGAVATVAAVTVTASPVIADGCGGVGEPSCQCTQSQPPPWCRL